MPASQRTLERRIRAVYTEAQKDLQKKLDDYIVKFRAKDAQMRQDLAEQAITQKEYDEWRQGAIFQGKSWRARLKQVTDTLANANEESLRLVRGEQLNEFAEGMNHEQFVLAQNTGLSINFGIYDAETVGKLIREQPDLLPPKKLNRGKDERWNQKKVTGSILQGIIQGESIDDIAKRIARDTARQNSKAMIRYARTATTGAQNAGRMETMHRAHGMGINVRKQWLATLDARTRDSHRHLDGQVKDIDDHFDSDYGKIMFPGDPSAHPGDVYNCFVGETNIATDSEIIRSYKHDYSGKLITVKTSSGVEFTCTPNHPILTPSGWVAAERLQDRNNLLIASIGEDDPLRINPYIEHAFTRIDAIHQLFDEMGSKRTARLGVNFHGDVPTTDVEIITQKRFLRNNRDSGCADGVNKLLLKHSDESLMGKGAFVQHFGSVWFAALRFMCGFGKALSLFGRRVIHAVVHGFRPIAGSDATVLQAQSDDVTGDVQFLRESLDGFSGKVFVDNIVNIKITTVSHVPVYNLQTSNSRYFVNSIIAQNGEKCNGKFAIAHNCRCTLIYVYPDYPTDPGERLDNITGEHVRGDMTYAEWAGTQPKAQPETKPAAARPRLETIEEAEAYAKSTFVDTDMWGSQGLSLQGISVDSANIVVGRLAEFYETYDVDKFSTLVAPAGNTKLGKAISGAHAGFNPMNRAMILNRKSLKDPETVREALAKERELVADYMKNPDKYPGLSTRIRKLLEASHKSGRATVPTTLEEAIDHECGHALEKALKKAPNYHAVEENMPKYADGISGYATTSMGEYIAESHCAWRRGEECVDPEMVKAFEWLRRGRK